MKELIKQMVREAMEGSEDLSTDQPETEFRGPAIEGQELLDALASDISDMYKDINGVRPRWINFGEMSQEELEQLHDQTTRQHEDWWNQERVEQDLDDLADEKYSINDEDRWDRADAGIEADAHARAEEEERLTPEAGEEFPKQSGMRRRVSESYMRRDTANKLYNLLIMEQEYGIITPKELSELKDAINKVLGVSVGNLL